MKNSSRREIIVDKVRQQGSVTLAELMQALPEVSETTLRRDLEALDRERQLVRVRGGAKSLESLLSVMEDSYANRLVTHAEEKRIIAQKAVRLVEPKTSLYLDSGSTAFCLATLFPDIPCVVTTSGLTCAMELSKLQNPTLQMPGGLMNKNSYSVNGDVSVSTVGQLNFNMAFLGVTGYLSGGRFVTSVAEDYLLKRTVVANSQRVIILMDSSKVGKVGTYTIASVDDVDTIVTDGSLPSKEVSFLESKGIIVL